jgi:murein DD-endopeptidase MepM/ murein hydrolase activator NlpD
MSKSSERPQPVRRVPTRAPSVAGAIAVAIAAMIVAGPQATMARADELAVPAQGERVLTEDGAVPASATWQPKRTFVVCPVDRPHHYVDDFGAARWVGGFHRHQGIDIFAARGTPIRAPFDGRVETSANWMGGIQLYVYGKKGFVFNGHLDRVAKTGKVKAGDIVGTVGNSGDAQGGSTHDHFEWHPNGGPAVDSFRLLNQACRGGPAIAEPPLRPSSRVL